MFEKKTVAKKSKKLKKGSNKVRVSLEVTAYCKEHWPGPKKRETAMRAIDSKVPIKRIDYYDFYGIDYDPDEEYLHDEVILLVGKCVLCQKEQNEKIQQAEEIIESFAKLMENVKPAVGGLVGMDKLPKGDF